jgi:hypothetical protein
MLPKLTNIKAKHVARPWNFDALLVKRRPDRFEDLSPKKITHEAMWHLIQRGKHSALSADETCSSCDYVLSQTEFVVVRMVLKQRSGWKEACIERTKGCGFNEIHVT